MGARSFQSCYTLKNAASKICHKDNVFSVYYMNMTYVNIAGFKTGFICFHIDFKNNLRNVGSWKTVSTCVRTFPHFQSKSNINSCSPFQMPKKRIDFYHHLAFWKETKAIHRLYFFSGSSIPNLDRFKGKECGERTTEKKTKKKPFHFAINKAYW